MSLFRSAAAVLACCAVGLGAGTTALADDGVSQDALIEADRAEILAVLADYDQVGTMNGDVIAYDVQPDGDCQLVHITARGVTSPMSYTVRRCPTENGWRESFVGGDGAIEDIEVQWDLADEGEGTRVRLSVFAKVARVPQFLVDQRTRRSVGQTLKKLADKLKPRNW